MVIGIKKMFMATTAGANDEGTCLCLVTDGAILDATTSVYGTEGITATDETIEDHFRFLDIPLVKYLIDIPMPSLDMPEPDLFSMRDKSIRNKCRKSQILGYNNLRPRTRYCRG
jgi:hypothetical protein